MNKDRTLRELVRYIQTEVMARAIKNKSSRTAREGMQKAMRHVNFSASGFRKRLVEFNRTVTEPRLRHSTDVKFIHRRIKALIELGHIEEVPGRKGRGSSYRITDHLCTYLSMYVEHMKRDELAPLLIGTRVFILGMGGGDLTKGTRKELRRMMTAFLDEPNEIRKREVISLMESYLCLFDVRKGRKKK